MVAKKPEKDFEKLNPKIASIEIGARSLRTITVYPLALGDQLKLTNMIQEGLQGYMLYADRSDMEVIQFMIEFFKSNIGNLLALITDEGEALIDEMTNDQVVDIAEMIYSMNFERAAKKVQSLFAEKGLLSSLERLSPMSAPITQDID